MADSTLLVVTKSEGMGCETVENPERSRKIYLRWFGEEVNFGIVSRWKDRSLELPPSLHFD